MDSKDLILDYDYYNDEASLEIIKEGEVWVRNHLIYYYKLFEKGFCEEWEVKNIEDELDIIIDIKQRIRQKKRQKKLNRLIILSECNEVNDCVDRFIDGGKKGQLYNEDIEFVCEVKHYQLYCLVKDFNKKEIRLYGNVKFEPEYKIIQTIYFEELNNMYDFNLKNYVIGDIKIN